MSFFETEPYRVSVLCAHRRSHYWSLPVVVFDARRDARTFRGEGPVIAHPPCRGWSRVRGLARPLQGEMELGRWCVEVVCRNGGVLEQPAHSRLWDAERLPLPGQHGRGGFSIRVNQCVWGHAATKPTWLFVVGCGWSALPELNDQVVELNARGLGLNELTLSLNDQVGGLTDWWGNVNRRRRTYLNGSGGKVLDLGPDDRELTPVAMCWWLEELASRCRRARKC